MNSHDWEYFGEEIRKTVQNAVENQDYDKLSQAIANTVNQAIDSVSNGVKNAAEATKKQYSGYKTYTTDYGKTKQKNSRERKSGVQYSNVKPQKNSVVQILEMRSPSKIGSIVAMALGYTFGFVALMIFFVLLLAGNLAIQGMATGFYMGAGFFCLLAATSTAAGALGTKKFFRINRFKNYVRTIGAKEYCNISVLAGKVGKADKYVVKDLEYMIQNRWFGQGHLDKQKTCLMVTDKVYQQYLQLEERKLLEQQETEEKQKKRTEALSGQTQEIRGIIEKGEAYQQRIRACNDAIPGEEISAKISRIEVLTAKIFDRVEQNPKRVSDIDKLLEYYLPTTVKLLEAYAQMDEQPTEGTNIQTAKKEIEATLDTLNTAFEKLLDDLFQDTAWDISSDISVLNTMLAQEGLKDDGLKTKK